MAVQVAADMAPKAIRTSRQRGFASKPRVIGAHATGPAVKKRHLLGRRGKTTPGTHPTGTETEPMRVPFWLYLVPFVIVAAFVVVY